MYPFLHCCWHYQLADPLGRDKEYLESITPEVVLSVKGRLIKAEGEDDEVEAEA